MKTSLNKEINNIRNAALSAYLMAFFTNAYYKEAQEFPNLQLLFVVYPLFYVEDILKLIEGTNIKRIRVEGHDVSMMCKSAEKVGIWFAKLPIAEIEQILKVRL